VHSHASDERRLLLALSLTGGFMLAETAGGILSGSLALLADAGHMLTDTVSLFLAWFAAHLSRRPADTLRSYGYHRIQILTAFLNGVFFLFIVAWIIYEAIHRLIQPVEVLGGIMLIVAILGLVVNVLAFWILHRGDITNLNLRAATLHVMGDLLGSVAAITAATVILFTGWFPIDPLLSVLVAVLILHSAWKVVKESAHILLEGTPQDIDVQRLKQVLIDEVPCVQNVHHVHIWSLTPDRPMLTLHVTVEANTDLTSVLLRVKEVLARHFYIHHSTIQVESGSCADD
jgi:cobalt-zinc-cadmium efflux system protein